MPSFRHVENALFFELENLTPSVDCGDGTQRFKMCCSLRNSVAISTASRRLDECGILFQMPHLVVHPARVSVE